MADFDNLGGQLDLTVRAGRHFYVPFSYTDQNGLAVDFTGATFKGQIRADEQPGGTLILDLASYITASGTNASVDIPDTVTATLSPQAGYWDLAYKPSGVGGQWDELLYGSVNIVGTETA